jgi:hypothetical protein
MLPPQFLLGVAAAPRRLPNPVPHRDVETLTDPLGTLASIRPKSTGTPELDGNTLKLDDTEDAVVGQEPSNPPRGVV